MTDLEYDLHMSIEWLPTQWGESEAEVDCEGTAKNLTELGYQKIVWHDVNRELPELNKNVSAYSEYVLGCNYYNQTYAVVSWDGIKWSDEYGICYDITHWTDLPKIKLEQ